MSLAKSNSTLDKTVIKHVKQSPSFSYLFTVSAELFTSN